MTSGRDAHRLAWSLADTLSGALPDPANHAIYTHLGCGHYRRSIAEALRSAVETGTAIPDSLAAEIDNWLDAYEGHPDQERIARLLTGVRRQLGGPPIAAVE
jgi:hypothetical protein